MNDFYCRYFEFDNWQYIKNLLLEHFIKLNPADLYWSIDVHEMKSQFSEIINHLEKIGVFPLQFIFLKTPGPTDLSSTDPNDSKTVYVHVDRKDSGNAADPELNKSIANFEPKYVLNIPLVNCDSTVTYFYKLKDKSITEIPWGGWGQEAKEYGLTTIDHNNLLEVDSIRLNKPAFLRVNVPHGVHNPSHNLRVVTTIRIRDDSPALWK